jgi:hypothetical protein
MGAGSFTYQMTDKPSLDPLRTLLAIVEIVCTLEMGKSVTDSRSSLSALHMYEDCLSAPHVSFE